MSRLPLSCRSQVSWPTLEPARVVVGSTGIGTILSPESCAICLASGPETRRKRRCGPSSARSGSTFFGAARPRADLATVEADDAEQRLAQRLNIWREPYTQRITGNALVPWTRTGSLLYCQSTSDRTGCTGKVVPEGPRLPRVRDGTQGDLRLARRRLPHGSSAARNQ